MKNQIKNLLNVLRLDGVGKTPVEIEKACILLYRKENTPALGTIIRQLSHGAKSSTIRIRLKDTSETLYYIYGKPIPVGKLPPVKATRFFIK